jgi:prepilin signal peptidase PulO-like enzyme (type II secretory pathway)
MEVIMFATLAVAFLFGTCIGSSLNVCVHRLPQNESIVLPPTSHPLVAIFSSGEGVALFRSGVLPN